MRDERRKVKHAALVDVLYRDHILSSSVLKDSMLARMAAQPLPLALQKDFPYGLLGSWVMAVLSIFSVYATHQGAYLLAFCSATTALLVLTAVGVYTVRKHSGIQQAKIQSAEALIELETQRGLLANYLEALDRRTSRYFHVVTSSKTTTYSILNQILAEMERVISECSTSKDISQIYRRLVGTIEVSDGLVSHSRAIHEIPLTQLSLVVADFQQLLEEGLIELEQEITYFRNIHRAQEAHRLETVKTH